MRPIITLTTDFGTVDGHVGAMKGVLLSICPDALLVDITHSIPPQDVRRAAWALWNAARHYPRGAVHLAVVDPGVGTPRRPLAMLTGGMFYVGPDNGLFTLVARPPDAVVALENPAFYRPGGPPSSTFHGRDIFAPAAAHLATGVPLEQFGPPVREWAALSFPPLARRSPSEWSGEVLYLDHFGNAVTNFGLVEWRGATVELAPLFGGGQTPCSLPARISIVCQERTLALCRTYSQVAPGEPLALIGSGGLLEIAVRDGSAATTLGVRPGDSIRVVAPE